MSTIQSPVSDMLVTVKTREVQRGMLAEMRGDQAATSRHLLAAAHLELVLADDYAQADQHEMSVRSRLSAASCLCVPYRALIAFGGECCRIVIQFQIVLYPANLTNELPR